MTRSEHSSILFTKQEQRKGHQDAGGGILILLQLKLGCANNRKLGHKLGKKFWQISLLPCGTGKRNQSLGRPKEAHLPCGDSGGDVVLFFSVLVAGTPGTRCCV
ncbi:hypothetical protein PGIGA_G00249670 [Pangasianodon gigas]|uniref:Uncharacterized protein n=1 Tax=Pangasianodon gigas TaxID=30993 RepID=A0ACC5WQA0_PANGG|nr:hypothetical protein [Pangasianodon gigas]